MAQFLSGHADDDRESLWLGSMSRPRGGAIAHNSRVGIISDGISHATEGKHRPEEEATGQTHVAKKKPLVVPPGSGDCGSGNTSIEYDESFYNVLLHEVWTPRSRCLLGPCAEDVSEALGALLAHTEADLNPHHWLVGSYFRGIQPFTHDRKYATVAHAMPGCYLIRDMVGRGHGLDHVDVSEMRGGTVRVSPHC